MSEDDAQGAASTGYDAWRVDAAAHVQYRFALQHLMGAASLSRRVGELERKHAGEGFGAFFEDILHTATACIFMAFASLEALGNELGEDLEIAPKLPPGTLFDEERLVDKFDALVISRGAVKLERGTSPVQDVLSLTSLRNGLVHFKPAPSHDQAAHQRISNRAGNRFRSPFLGTSEMLFPIAWASHARSCWAVGTVVALEALLMQQVGLPSRFAKHAGRLSG
jgi:hypothetical protein